MVEACCCLATWLWYFKLIVLSHNNHFRPQYQLLRTTCTINLQKRQYQSHSFLILIALRGNQSAFDSIVSTPMPSYKRMQLHPSRFPLKSESLDIPFHYRKQTPIYQNLRFSQAFSTDNSKCQSSKVSNPQHFHHFHGQYRATFPSCHSSEEPALPTSRPPMLTCVPTGFSHTPFLLIKIVYLPSSKSDLWTDMRFTFFHILHHSQFPQLSYSPISHNLSDSLLHFPYMVSC